MKYNGFYFRLFSGSMKKVLAEKYGVNYARTMMKKSRRIYREQMVQSEWNLHGI